MDPIKPLDMDAEVEKELIGNDFSIQDDPANEVTRDNDEAVLVDGDIISENDPY